MLVLTILGLIAGAIVIFALFVWVNEFTDRKYNHPLFDTPSAVMSVFAYWGLFMGTSWYQSALKSGADVLNGQIIFLIGLALLLYVVRINFLKYGFLLGVVSTIFQQILYVGLSYIGVFLIIGLVAVASQMKPVYNVN